MTEEIAEIAAIAVIARDRKSCKIIASGKSQEPKAKSESQKLLLNTNY